MEKSTGNKMTDITTHIVHHRFIPVFYSSNEDWSIRIFNTCYAAGLRVFEFTNRGADALRVFKQLIRYKNENCSGMTAGAGTILTGKSAEEFIKSGSAFIVSPCFIKEVLVVCKEYEVPYFPGCMTVKEVFEANAAGCTMIKIFPGDVLTSKFVSAVKSFLPEIKLMVTGGVSNENIPAWFSAGADAVGLGSNFFSATENNDQFLQKLGNDLQNLVAKKRE